MKQTRTEIMPGVNLNHIQTDKFKIAVMSISLLTQLNRETAAMNALIPFVLRRGTAHYGDMEKISNRLDELYYSTLDPIVRRIGEIQCVGLLASYPEDNYLPEGETVAKDAIGLMCEMLINPLTRGGLLMRSYVESERDKLADTIRSRINEKGSYAVSRCIEEMCCFEDFSVGRYGSAEDCESIRYKKLTQQYHKLLETSPVEIFYCGNDSCKRIAGMLKDALCTMPRGEIDYEIGTDVRMNAVEDEPRIYTETLDVTQGRLVIGFRLGECMEDPDKASLSMFNTIFGAGVTSKLFTNVREKMQLCYYASSFADSHKGLLIASAGIDFDKYDLAKDEILHQLDEIRNGNITDDEMETARKGICSDLSSMQDSQGTMESYTIGNVLDGWNVTPEEYIELVKAVTKEDVIAIAQSTVCDMIYFLRGEEKGEDPEDEEGEPNLESTEDESE